MITVQWLYVLAGLAFASFAVASARNSANRKRWSNTAFWSLMALSFWFGNFFGDVGNGVVVLALVALAGARMLGPASTHSTTVEQRQSLSGRYGNNLFVPALIIPFTAFLGTLLFNYTPLANGRLIDPKAVTLVLLGLGVIAALIVCYAWLKPPAMAPVDEGGRLADSIGWALVLPQMLAALGAVFALAGVGEVVGGLATRVLPPGSLFAAVAVYALGMAAFTMIMGNAFAAFPVMAGAVGLPILIHHFHGNPAAIAAIGMLAGFCGTLMTPMAANFNIVPAALLELRDRNAVVKAQVGTAIPLLLCNLLLIWWLAF
jgi:uncharacterized membrane protein